MKNNKPFAEIVYSTLTTWTAQSWQWDIMPSFGSLIVIHAEDITLLGIVYHIETGSLDPSRVPCTYQKTYQELLQEQPHIFTFLKTTFSCIPAGVIKSNIIFYTLPQKPPLIHAFVQYPDPETVALFFKKASYLPLIFAMQATIFNIDELLLALLSWQAQQKLLSQEYIIDFMKTYNILTGNEYRRIKTFIGRVETLL